VIGLDAANTFFWQERVFNDVTEFKGGDHFCDS
jgi:hypothetical protein